MRRGVGGIEGLGEGGGSPRWGCWGGGEARRVEEMSRRSQDAPGSMPLDPGSRGRRGSPGCGDRAIRGDNVFVHTRVCTGVYVWGGCVVLVVI